MYQFSVSPSQCMSIVMMLIEDTVPNHQCENCGETNSIVIPVNPSSISKPPYIK